MNSFSSRGSALLITIFFISIITLVAIGFMSTARVERASSKSHYERMRAGEFARSAIEGAVATLQKETAYRYKVSPLDPGTGLPDNSKKVYYYRNYLTQPGALIVPIVPTGTSKDAEDQPLVKETRSLSTETTVKTHAKAVFNPANLNVQTFDNETDKTHLITERPDPKDPSKAIEMKLRWLYVYQAKPGGTKDPSQWRIETDFGKSDTEEPLLGDKNRPVIGRYAYWVDDENTKVNYNLAWKRGDKNDMRYTHLASNINLTALTTAANTPLSESAADAIHYYTTDAKKGGGGPGPRIYFNSFADARQVDAWNPGGKASDFLTYNKFELTHYSHDPDTTFFGEERILLTTNPKLVPSVFDPVTRRTRYTRRFIDILREDKSNPDPGDWFNIAGGQNDYKYDPTGKTILPNKFDGVVRTIIRYISEKNWPISPGKTFKDKYYPGSQDSDARLAQIACNIIDYVRAKESQMDVIAPLRFAFDASGKFSMDDDVAFGKPKSFQGVCRGPYVTEMGYRLSEKPETIKVGTTDKTVYRCIFKMELYLPTRYNLPNGIELVPSAMRAGKLTAGIDGWFIMFTGAHSDPKHTFYGYAPGKDIYITINSHGTWAAPILAAEVSGADGTILMPGKFVTITKTYFREQPYNSPSSPDETPMRGAVYKGKTGADGWLASPLNAWPRTNIAPQEDAKDYTIADPLKSDNNNFPSLETNDPRASVAAKDWTQVTKNTFGSRNSVSTLGKAGPSSSATPQQDTDENGNLTDYSAYMPPPYKVGTNDDDHDGGRVISIGELGYVMTGNDAKKEGQGSVSWRTLRLQPNSFNENGTLPDWALMDLFGVPSTSTASPKEKPVYLPHDTSVGGRINVNSHVEPFKDMERSAPLLAAFKGAGGISDATTVARNVYARKLTQKGKGVNGSFGKAYGYPWTMLPAADAPNAFDTPGEVCEIEGVADKGETGEDLVRDIASLITARGGVFSVYSIGQSLQETPSGQVIVTGEQRQQAVVERYIDNKNTINTNLDDVVRFRALYFRNLTP